MAIAEVANQNLQQLFSFAPGLTRSPGMLQVMDNADAQYKLKTGQR